MTGDPEEDEATTWAGDTDPSHIESPAPRVEPVKTSSAEKPRPSTPSILLVTYGILGGICLIYTVGWIVTVQRSTMTLPNLFGEIMFQFGEFLAIASPAIWFAGVFLLTRGRKPIARLLWLLLGLVAVIPWPFVLGV